MTEADTDLLNLIRHRGVHQSEEQVTKGTGLSPQDTGGHTPGQSQGQVIGQQPKAELEEVVMLPVK